MQECTILLAMRVSRSLVLLQEAPTAQPPLRAKRPITSQTTALLAAPAKICRSKIFKKLKSSTSGGVCWTFLTQISPKRTTRLLQAPFKPPRLRWISKRLEKWSRTWREKCLKCLATAWL